MSENTSEEWRPVAGFEGLYEVSSHGRVRSHHTASPRYLKAVLKGRGYYGVNLYKDKVQHQQFIHRLVLIAFRPRRDSPLLFALHSDGDMRNNHLDNLRWGTHEDNMRDMVAHGTSANQNTRKVQCHRGHEFSSENTYTNRKGARICRQCHRTYSREYSARTRRGNQA